MSATEKTFEREPRYLVIKVNDALAHLGSSEIYALSEMGEKITKGRSSAGKLPLVAVVVEQDWPEFELAWEMIKARVTGKGNDARRVVACLNACEGISTENLEDNLPVKDLARQYSEAIRQRDELLAALEKAAAVFRAYSELHDSKGATEKAISNMQHAMSCEEAIARVKGGAA